MLKMSTKLFNYFKMSSKWGWKSLVYCRPVFSSPNQKYVFNSLSSGGRVLEVLFTLLYLPDCFRLNKRLLVIYYPLFLLARVSVLLKSFGALWLKYESLVHCSYRRWRNIYDPQNIFSLAVLICQWPEYTAPSSRLAKHSTNISIFNGAAFLLLCSGVFLRVRGFFIIITGDMLAVLSSFASDLVGNVAFHLFLTCKMLMSYTAAALGVCTMLQLHELNF